MERSEWFISCGKNCIQRQSSQYSRKYPAVMTLLFHRNRYFGICLSTSVAFYAFVSLPPSFLLSSSQSSALMSQAHCAEWSWSDVSVLWTLYSRDWVWDDKASFFLVCSRLQYLPLQHSLPSTLLFSGKNRREKRWNVDSKCKVGTTWGKRSRNDLEKIKKNHET